MTLHPHGLFPRRTNLATHPSFEDASLANFDPYQCTLASVTTPYVIGSRAVKMTATVGGGQQLIEQGAANRWPVVPGQVYTFSCWVRPSVSCNVGVGTREFDTAGNFLGQNWTPVSCTANVWTRIASTVTVPANQSSWGWVVTTALPNISDTCYVDGVLVELGGSMGTYFDGSTPGSWWDGTPNASTSGAPPAGVRQNLAPNPSFETTTTGWRSDGIGGSPGRAPRVVEGQLRPDAGGSYYGYYYTGGTPGTGFIGGCNYPGLVNPIRVVPGEAYSASIFLGSSYGSVTVKAGFLDSGGAWCPGSPVTSQAVAQGAGLYALLTNAVAPASAVAVDVEFWNDISQPVNLSIDGLLVEPSPNQNPYFDGAMSGAVWDGTAHESVSHQGALTTRESTGSADIEVTGPTTGFVVTGERAATLLDAAAPLPGIGVRPVYSLAPPDTDDFNRPDDLDPPIGPNWGSYSNGTDLPALRNGRVEALAPAADNPQLHYFFQYWNRSLPPPCYVAFDIFAYSTHFDHYVELNAFDPTYAPAKAASFIELGWWRRPVWDPGNPVYANGGNIYNTWRAVGQYAAFDQLVVPDWLPGDRMLLAYDGVSAKVFRRPAGTRTWQALLSARPDPRFKDMLMSPTFWFSNYDAADGGGNAWGNFEFGQF